MRRAIVQLFVVALMGYFFAHGPFACAQIASLDKGHQLLVNNGLQIWGVNKSTEYSFNYNDLAAANMNGVIWGFPAVGGTGAGSLTTGQKWGKWTDPYGSPSTSLTAAESAHASDLIALSVGDERDFITQGSADYNATVNWYQTRNANNYQYFPNTLCYVNHFQINDTGFPAFIAAANPDAISFDSYPFSNPDGSYITSYNWLSLAQHFRRHGLGSYIGATANSPRPYGMYLQTFYDTLAIEPGEAEIRWQQFAGLTMGYTFLDAYVYTGGNTDFDQKGTLYNNFKESARQALNLGPALTHLISYGYGTSIVRGQDASGATKAVPGDWLVFNKNNAPANQQYLTSVSVANLGT